MKRGNAARRKAQTDEEEVKKAERRERETRINMLFGLPGVDRKRQLRTWSRMMPRDRELSQAILRYKSYDSGSH